MLQTLGLIAGLGAAVPGCGKEADARAEARVLMTSLNAVSLEAEVAQAEARKVLSDANPDTADGPLDQANSQNIAAGIARSNRALATAKERFPECERAMRNLVREAR